MSLALNICDYIHYKVWDEIIYSRKWIGNFITNFIWYVITYLCQVDFSYLQFTHTRAVIQLPQMQYYNNEKYG